MIKKLKTLAITLLCSSMAATAFGSTPENVFVSGRVQKGDDVVTSFAAPVLLGRTLPLKDTQQSGPMTTVADVDLTPQKMKDGKVTILVKTLWSQRIGIEPPDSKVGSSIEQRTTLNQTVEVGQGESKIIPFGDCKMVSEKVECSHKLVVSARPQ